MYLPIKQTVEQEMAYKRMQSRVEELKQEMGTKYLLAKENAIQRKGEGHESTNTN